jgi:BirA family biotin operon repressor/biotin-[acetyl-CoA-carboxylase] ligase
VSGILVERREATVVGIGINVAIKPHEFPPDLRLPATSLDELLSAPVDRTDLLNQVLDELDGRYQDSLLRGPETLWGEWTILAEDLCGKDVIAWTAQEGVAGRLLDLRPDRGARLRLPHGQERTLPPEMLLRITPPGAPAAP